MMKIMKPRLLSITSLEIPMLIDQSDKDKLIEEITIQKVEASGNIFKNSETMIELRSLEFSLLDFVLNNNGYRPV